MPLRFTPLTAAGPGGRHRAPATSRSPGAHRAPTNVRGAHRRPEPQHHLARAGAATAALLALLVAAPLTGPTSPGAGQPTAGGGALADRTESPSRSMPRASTPSGEPAEEPPAAESRATEPVPSPDSEPEPEPEPQPEPQAEPEPAPDPQPAAAPEPPAPVGGLNERQMEHAATIVRVGQELGLPEYAYVVALATVLQESYLRILASPAVPESFDHPHDASSVDHDSVGLFQQRPSMGWGTVAQCMDPEYSARTFYRALQRVNGWENMAVTVAAQAVQRSAFPNHYAKHEPLARQLVAAVTPS